MSQAMNEQNVSHPLTVLEELSRLRQRPVLLLCGTSLFSSDTDTMLYAFLRELGHQKTLDVVLQSPGGHPTASRRLAVLLREFTNHLTVLVLQHAHSAGALFCLAADELVMSPLSTLSPIDPQLPGQPLNDDERTTMPGQKNKHAMPYSIATEEMRLFSTMASEWFGIGETIEERLSLLHTSASRIFPTTLTALFRADQEMRQAANELLRYHQPDTSIRQRISDQFISNFFSHKHAIHRQEVRELGLNIADTTEEEEVCLWYLLHWWQAYQQIMPTNAEAPEHMQQIRSVLLASGFAALDVMPMPFVTPAGPLLSTAEGSPDLSTSPVFPRYPGQYTHWGWRQVPLDALSLDRDSAL